MNEPKISRAMAHIDDDLISGAVKYRPKKAGHHALTKWIAIAACFCFVLLGTFTLPGLFPKEGEELLQDDSMNEIIPEQAEVETEAVQSENQNNVVVNEVTSVAEADMDVQISVYDGISEDERTEVEAEFERVTGIRYDDFIVKIPDTLTIRSFYSVNTLTDASEKEYAPHDYVFECNTKADGKVKLAVSALGPVCRDCYMVTEEPVKSQIRGIDMVIYGWDGMYFVEFSCDSRFYDIETSNITLEELENLLVSLIG